MDRGKESAPVCSLCVRCVFVVFSRVGLGWHRRWGWCWKPGEWNGEDAEGEGSLDGRSEKGGEGWP